MNFLKRIFKKDKTIPCTITQEDGFYKTCITVMGEKSFSVEQKLSNFGESFYSLSEKIEQEPDILKKLDYCEQSLPLLSDFVKFSLEEDEDLPPCINCRDTAPEMYMRLGRWDDAERYIKACIEANAYYPQKGEEEYNEFLAYKKTAIAAVDFLSKNPGFLQKNLYKALADQDISQLKHFTRCSKQIQKVPVKNTNELYVNEALLK